MNGHHIVIKEDEIFLVTNSQGNVDAQAGDGQGLYFQDTRFLSLYDFTVDEFVPVLLSAAGELSFMTTLQLANGPAELPDGRALAARSISIRRNRFLQDGLHERIGFFNYNPFPVRATVRLLFGSDFRDMFDVRGYASRDKHGAIGSPLLETSEIVLPYHGLDGVERRTHVWFEVVPTELQIVNAEARLSGPVVEAGISGHGDPRTEVPIVPPTVSVVYELELLPKLATSLSLHVRPLIGETPPPAADHAASLDEAYRTIRASYQHWDRDSTEIASDDEVLNHLLRQSQGDLRLLMNQLPTGWLPMAGIPWFSVPFGRDSLITSYETLLLQPAIAYGTLRFLAHHQGKQVNDWRDEEPGKILHEIRAGELVIREEVPFGPYYGSVDATPLFLVVLGELVQWTGDWEFATSLRANVEGALDWIDRYGDLDGDGYVEYKTRSARGIRNQGWKDSYDAISYRDGRPAEPPIALSEVQGYVYAAKCHAASFYTHWGEPARAAALRDEAEALRERFERDFWHEAEGYYAMALDAAKQPVVSVGSNAGHLLWSGIVSPARAAQVVRRLVAPDMLCGWGVRTLSSAEPTFNPMSYHNGSVWPHDNALVAAGMRRYGFAREALEVTNQVFAAGVRFPGYRIPELYCGFTRDRHYHSLPADYPVSCRPQAWAAGSVFLLLQQALGLRPDPEGGRVVLRPRLAASTRTLSLRRLAILGSQLDLDVRADEGRAHVGVQGDGQPGVLVEGDDVSVLV